MSTNASTAHLSDDEIIDELVKRGWEKTRHGLADTSGVPVETSVVLRKVTKY